MKRFKFNYSLSSVRLLAILLSLFLVVFAGYVFITQSSSSDLVNAKIVEILELEDDQGIIYQNYLVSISDSEQKQIQIPLNLPEVRDLDKGDRIYLERSSLNGNEIEYKFASTDKTFQFIALLVVFGTLILVILGISPLKNLFPAMVFLVLIAAGVFNLSLETRYVFLSMLGFMAIISLISVLWYFEDIILGMITSMVVVITLIFSLVLYALLLSFTGSADSVAISELLTDSSLVYEFAQAKLLVVMILSFGLLISLMLKIVKSAIDYVKKKKNIGKFNLIKYVVEQVQLNVGDMLNIIFFLALGLNFTGLVSEDFSRYRFVWNNSFFLGIVVDGIVIGSVLLIGGYVLSLVVSLYLERKDSLKPAKK